MTPKQILMIVAIVALLALLALRAGGPRITQITRTREKKDDDA